MQGEFTAALMYYWVYALLLVGVSVVWFTFAVPLAGIFMRAVGLRTNLHLVGLLAVAAGGCGLLLAALLSLAPRSEVTGLGAFVMTAYATFYGVVSGVLHVRDAGHS
jgi:hypothetical protein